MEKRHIIYNESLKQLKEQVREGKALIIQPAASLAVSRTEKNPDKLKAIYELGRKDATEKLAKIQEFLA